MYPSLSIPMYGIELSQQQMSKVTEVCNHPEAEAESNTRLSGILISDKTQPNASKQDQSQQHNDVEHNESSSHSEHNQDNNEHNDESKDKTFHAASIPKPMYTLPAELTPSHEPAKDSNVESSSNHVFQVSAGFMLIATAFGFLVNA